MNQQPRRVNTSALTNIGDCKCNPGNREFIAQIDIMCQWLHHSCSALEGCGATLNRSRACLTAYHSGVTQLLPKLRDSRVAATKQQKCLVHNEDKHIRSQHILTRQLQLANIACLYTVQPITQTPFRAPE